MDVGVTGSRHGLTLAQMTAVTRELVQIMINHFMGAHDLHHGDCQGVDVQVAAIAAGLDYFTVAHPPSDERLRGFHPSRAIRPPADYLQRDRDIVDETELLLACPDGPERPKSGTWYTINYAHRIGRRVVLIQPDGSIINTKTEVS
jgi:hypothetical protein